MWLGTGRWSEGWLWVSLALWVASTAVAVGVIKATGERVAALAAASGEGPVPPALEQARGSARWTAGAEALIASDVATLLLMATQPGLAGSVGVIAAAGALAFAVHAARAHRRPQRLGSAQSSIHWTPNRSVSVPK